MGSLLKKPSLSDFQKEKLLHEFRMFYDLDGDGSITWQDFEIAKSSLNGWAADSEKVKQCESVFEIIWASLKQLADRDSDERISGEEWVGLWLGVQKQLREQKKHEPCLDDLPMWCYQYLKHRFHVFDRTGDGIIDEDEFEYVLSNFDVAAPNARKAWMLISENNAVKMDFQRFGELATEYYFSKDPAALGNFITGRLTFESAVFAENKRKGTFFNL